MNRRGFLQLLGMAAAGSTVAYSFPTIIVPNNIEVVEDLSLIEQLNTITKKEIYPALIDDLYFTQSPFISYLRDTIDCSYKGLGIRECTIQQL